MRILTAWSSSSSSSNFADDAHEEDNEEGSSSSSSFSSASLSLVFFHFFCPSLGCLVATAMFAAPIAALRRALVEQSLGELNPRPWAVMTGNCFGWCAYAYYIQNPFILASNIPGFLLSMWLNAGAAKLQYKQMTTPVRRTPTSTRRRTRSGPQHRPAPTPVLHIPNDESDSNGGFVDNPDENDDDNDDNDDDIVGVAAVPLATDAVAAAASNDDIIFTPQEIWWLRVMIFWSWTLVWVGWISPFPGHEASTIGLLVNLNAIFFYGAPLQTISQVVRSRRCNSIHLESMVMSIGNSSFWLLYGIALWDPVLMVPNSIGLSLGLCQLVLCILYPRKPSPTSSSSSSSYFSLATNTPAFVHGASVQDDNHIAMTDLKPSSTVPPDGIFRDL